MLRFLSAVSADLPSIAIADKPEMTSNLAVTAASLIDTVSALNVRVYDGVTGLVGLFVFEQEKNKKKESTDSDNSCLQ